MQWLPNTLIRGDADRHVDPRGDGHPVAKQDFDARPERDPKPEPQPHNFKYPGTM